MVRPRLVRAKRSTAIDTFRLEPRAALVARPPEASAGEANSEAATTPAATAASHNRHCWRIYLPPSLDGPRPCARRGSTRFEASQKPPSRANFGMRGRLYAPGCPYLAGRTGWAETIISSGSYFALMSRRRRYEPL